MHIIAGTLKNQPIAAPKGEATRPTSSRLRETLFNICQGYIEGSSFLDLFAGSGAIGLEALSRGAKSCTFADINKESIRCIQQNVKSMHVETLSKVLYGDVFSVLKKLARGKAGFDIIYADPPYEKVGKAEGKLISYSEKVLQFVDENHLLNPGGHLFIEDARSFIPQTEQLKSLVLINSRHAGRTNLYQFEDRKDELRKAYLSATNDAGQKETTEEWDSTAGDGADEW